ncbi:CGNR zinc finger domain-containing protein [Fodinicola feengrottensis]|uniref:CGNR zinc finger domain-containing protein n=1 Tax=Fodinicola feengrottensis TaxID=435914 RepID=UPI0031E0F481
MDLFRGTPTPTEVVAVLTAHGEPGPIELTNADLAQLRLAAQALATVFRADSTAAAAERLNELFHAYAGPPRLTAHDNTGWHLHIDAEDDGPWGRWLLTSSAWALATLLAQHQTPPGGQCAAPDCERPYVNAGNGGPRRFCSSKCATRVRVANHRRRASS